MLDQYSSSQRSLIYSKVTFELFVIVVIIYNFYNGILILLFGLMYLIVRVRQYNRKSLEDLLCL